MNDQLILLRVHALVVEERALRDGAPAASARLLEIENELERCWELLSHERTRIGCGETDREPEAKAA